MMVMPPFEADVDVFVFEIDFVAEDDFDVGVKRYRRFDRRQRLFFGFFVVEDDDGRRRFLRRPLIVGDGDVGFRAR